MLSNCECRGIELRRKRAFLLSLLALWGLNAFLHFIKKQFSDKHGFSAYPRRVQETGEHECLLVSYLKVSHSKILNPLSVQTLGWFVGYGDRWAGVCLDE